MKRLPLFLASAMAALTLFAAKPTARLGEILDDIRLECPVDIHQGWTVQTVSNDDNTVTLTMIVDVPADKFAAMKNDPATLKQRFLAGFARKAKPSGGLVSEITASGMNLEVDMVSPVSVESITITFTPAELAGALKTE